MEVRNLVSTRTTGLADAVALSPQKLFVSAVLFNAAPQKLLVSAVFMFPQTQNGPPKLIHRSRSELHRAKNYMQPSQPSKGTLADRDRDDHCPTVLIFTSASPLAHKSVSFPLLGLGVGGKTVAIASQFATLFHLWGVEKSLCVSLLLADKKGRPISICHH